MRQVSANKGPDGVKPAENAHLTSPEKRGTATAADESAVPLTDGADSGTIAYTGPSIYKRYSDLMQRYHKLLLEVAELRRPTRSQEQVERQLAAISRFLGTMNDSEGAVTAANLYTAEYFEGEQDSKFLVPLLTMLIEKYSGAEPLIVPTYNYWVSLLNKEQSV